MAKTLEDPAVTSLRDRFVWASLDNDEEVNQAAFTRYPLKGLPTLLILAPDNGEVVLNTGVSSP
jgi:hypothetical protein